MSSFRKLAIASSIATFLLITIGGLVRSTGSGLGCDDSWPDCSGRIIPDFHNYKVVIEFGHRLVALIIIILIGTLVVRALRQRAQRPQLVVPSVGAFGLVLFQALLGAVVVKLELHAESVVIHLSAALALFALLIYIVGLASAGEGDIEQVPDKGTASSSAWAAGAVLFLLLVGSYMSGYEGSGRAFNDWPLMGGQLIPDLGVQEYAIHFFHRALAAIVGVILLFTLLPVIRKRSEAPIAARLAHIALGAFALEILVGALNVWTDLHPAAVTTHLMLGAIIWGSLVGIVVVSSPRVRERAHQSTRTVSVPVRQGA
ncbi:MAG: COX15/CtaA family protein [Actinomycetota bacterium]